MSTMVTEAARFDLTAALYLREPDLELVETVSQDLPDQFSLQATELTTLRQDYHDLFLVPVSGRYLPPFESVVREERLMGRSMVEVAQLYQAVGFEPERLSISVYWQHQVMADHIGFELAFFSSLLHNQATAGPVTARQLQQLIEYFWEQHLSQWLEEYGRRLAQTARTPLYRFLGEVTISLGLAQPGRAVDIVTGPANHRSNLD